MELFLNDNINHKRYYIKEGLLEPVHLGLKERDILMHGIQQAMQKCKKEIDISEKMFAEKIGKRSKVLPQQKAEIEELSNYLNQQIE